MKPRHLIIIALLLISSIATLIITVAATRPPRAGYVYVISNIGSFGNDIYKIGFTTRNDPRERVKELGDASVPFPFDVHILIKTDSAAKLETAIHNELNAYRVNKANGRKEFFKCDLDKIIAAIQKHHAGRLDITREPSAWEYRTSTP
jgi:hypothetical protein